MIECAFCGSAIGEDGACPCPERKAYDKGFRAGLEEGAHYVESVCTNHAPGTLVTHLGAANIAAAIRKLKGGE